MSGIKPGNDADNNPYRAASQDFAQISKSERVRNPNPQVVVWQLVYVVCMLILTLSFAIGGFLLTAFADQFVAESEEGSDIAAIRMVGVLYGVMGLGTALLYAIGLFWRRGFSGWVYQIILIAAGLTTCCTWPATIPLLIYWIKDKDDIVAS